MAAFIIVNVFINDQEAFERYKQLTPATVAAYGGRFIVRGGAVTPLEGNWDTGRLVVLEFPDKATAEAWWHSPEYAIAKSIRQQAASSDMVLVEGY
ncbi:MAG TPA: DUF1330 domain-containing protein [Ferruginibacter sp.]|nr:DUF1330 domain-containing protein [Ferruginibacter sp.]HMP20967.1 DUF1330 domain-containing protein [Ferruginibacter sp.]